MLMLCFIIDNDLGLCCDDFSRAWGMPCKHMLLDMMNIKKTIKILDFC